MVSIIGCFRLLARLFPAPPLHEVTRESFEQLLARHQNGERIRIWGGFLGYLAVTGGLFYVLFQLSQWNTRDVQTLHYLGPIDGLYLIIAGVMGLHVVAALAFLTYRILHGRDAYRVMIAFHGEMARRATIGMPVDYGNASYALLGAMCPLWLLLALLHMDAYTSCREQDIVMNSVWSLGRRTIRPYTEVAGVIEVQMEHGWMEDQNAPYQVILFKDGRRWDLAHGRRGHELAAQRDLAMFVAQKCGRRVEKVPFDEDLPEPGDT